jgi:putative ABC transport system permease protein
MFKLAMKSTLAHRRRLVGTALSVIIGIAFLAGTFVFTDTIQRTFDNLFADVWEETDAVVRSSESVDADFGDEVRGTLPDSLIPEVAQVPGVGSVVGDITQFAQIVGKDGDEIGNPGMGAPTFGGVLEDDPTSPWRITEGSRFPSGPDEVVVDVGSMKKGDLKIGDTVTVIASAGSRTFELVGTVKFGDADSPGGATFALFDLPTAQDFLGRPGEVDSILVKGEGNISEEELAKRIRRALPADANAEVLTGAEITKESQDDIEEGLQFFNILLLVFAGVALFVGSFIIYNTFSIIVAQRQRENALLRAMGASRGQVLGSLLVESVVVGLVASAIGFLGGILMASVLEGFLGTLGIDIPSGGVVLKPRTLIVSLVVGVVITVFAAVVPAVRASKVPPVAAMSDLAIDSSAHSRSRLVAGVLITVLSIVGTIAGLAGEPLLLAFGIPMLFIGVFVLGPLIARPVARLIGAPLPALKGMTGTLARENAMRNPKRTARTAAALMVGVALVAGISVLAASIKSSIREIFDEQFTGDFVVSSDTFGFGGLPTTLADELNELPEVDTATGVGIGYGTIDGEGEPLSLIDPTTARGIFDFDFEEGSLTGLSDQGILVSRSRADRDNLKLGDRVPLILFDGQVNDLTVQGIYDADELAGPYTITKQLYADGGGETFDFAVFITKVEGVSDADAERAIESVAAAFPNGEVESRADYIDSQASQINQFVNLIYGLLALAVIIAVFGISNTLSLSLYERTRELGLLRAVGMYRSQVRSAVRWESVITAMLGTLQGIVIGVLLGYAVIVALRDEGLSSFTLPVVTLVLVVVIAFVFGVVAAIRPAIRASKLDVLQAVASP